MATIDNLIEFADDSVGIGEIPEVPVSRRNFLNWLGGTMGVVGASAILPSEVYAQRRKKGRSIGKHAPSVHHENPKHSHINYSKLQVPKISYDNNIAETNLKGVGVANRYSRLGRIQRTLRWSNIAEAVSARYGIPTNYLLGMISQESFGDPTVPNLSGDGGAGLIHMQPLLTSKYGLKMITDSKKLRDRLQGKEIQGVLTATGHDLKQLIDEDERFHPVKNIDAAARMVCDYYEQNGHSWSEALFRYAGRRSYPTKIFGFANDINNPKFMSSVSEDFANRNRNFRINGKPFTFDNYLRIFHNSNEHNYGLLEYKKLLAQRVHKT